tara:strand:- start:625 stop:996 length:372 start_codon:yes stop_codon:yes gene_type:complete
MAGLTDRQKERQVSRIYEIIFFELPLEEEEEVPEGQIKVEMRPEIRKIFVDNLPLGVEIEIKDLETAMRKMVKKIVQYICEENSSINKDYAYNIVTYIVADLINLNISYSDVSTDSDFNPMYG